MALLLAVATTAAAQVRITPQLKEGLKKTYHYESFVATDDSQQVSSNFDQTYEVLASNADSAVVSLTYSNFQQSNTGQATNIGGLFMGLQVRFSVNLDGSVRHLLNGKEMREKYPADSDDSDSDYLDYLFSDNYLVSNMVNSPIGLFGKTITDGMQEQGDDSDMTYHYQLSADGHTVDIHSASADDAGSLSIAKQFVFGQDWWPTVFSFSIETDLGREMGKNKTGMKATLVE